MPNGNSGNVAVNVASGMANFWFAGLTFWGRYAAVCGAAFMQGAADAPRVMREKDELERRKAEGTW